MFRVNHHSFGLFRLASGFLACSLLAVSQAQVPVKIEVCSVCNSNAAFAHRAEQVSIHSNPFLQGIDQVYVVNARSAEVRFFHVERWQESPVEPQSNALNASTAKASLMSLPLAQATPMPPDPDVLSAAQEAIAAIQLAQTASTLEPSVDLGLASAIELIGPDDSLAGVNRNALKNILGHHLNQTWSRNQIGLGDLANDIVRKFLTKSEIKLLGNATVAFEDGTRIQVNFERTLDGLQGSDVFFEPNVRIESITGPGLLAVPQTPGQFDGFNFTGNPLTVQALVALAQIQGIPVTAASSGSGGGDNGTFKCPLNGTQLKCQATFGVF